MIRRFFRWVARRSEYEPAERSLAKRRLSEMLPDERRRLYQQMRANWRDERDQMLLATRPWERTGQAYILPPN